MNKRRQSVKDWKRANYSRKMMKLVLHPDPHPLQREMTEGANIEQSDRELIPRLIPQKGPQSEWVMITEGHHLMFKKHMRLMQDIVKRSQKSWYSTTIEEVTSAACIGMIYAIVTWDPEKNFQFSTWATTIFYILLLILLKSSIIL
jgi:DNA-directed RNA polymerase sigma subunit (sigma70/sigma32)